MIGNFKNVNYRSMRISTLVLGISVVCFIVISQLNFTFFHMLIELICITAAFNLSMSSMSIKGFNNDDSLIILGFSYGMVGVVDLLHIIAFLGIPIMGVSDFNLASKLWLSSRLIEALALITYLYAIQKKHRGFLHKHSNIIFIILTVILLLLSFDSGLANFYTGRGNLSAFIMAAELMISIAYAAVLLMLHKERSKYSPIIYKFMYAAIVLKAIDQLLFCLADPKYEIVIIAGHIIRYLSFYFLYKVVIENILISPYRALERSHYEMELLNEQMWDEMDRRMETQRQLLHQLEFTQKVIDSIPNPIFYKDSKGYYKSCNKAFEHFMGIKKSDIVGKTVFEISDRSIAVKLCQIESLLHGETEIHTYDTELQNSEGEKRHVILSKAAIRGEYEKKAGIVGTIIDITNRKRYEIELRNNELRSRTLIQLLPEALYIHDGSVLLYTNSAGMRLMGAQKKEDIIGKTVIDFIHDEFKPKVIERIKGAKLYGKHGKTIEEKVLTLDGSIVDVEVTTTPFPYKGKNCILVVCHDITERKKSEENLRMLNHIKELDRLKTEFFSNISHELRTPLNVLLGSLQLMDIFLKKDSVLNENVKFMKYSQMMRQNCYRLLRLVNNLIDITKMDSGYFELHLKNYNIVSVVENITQSVVDYAENKGISVSFDTDLEEKFIACDADKIERIMLNLLSNSIKFTGEGGSIWVTVSDMSEKIRIAVKDNGVGIPENKKQEVFERFRQVDELLTRKHEGSGIGLSLVKSIVEMHDGEVYVESEYGKGSEFIVELPARTLEEEYSKEWINEQQTNIERINVEFSDIYG